MKNTDICKVYQILRVKEGKVELREFSTGNDLQCSSMANEAALGLTNLLSFFPSLFPFRFEPVSRRCKGFDSKYGSRARTWIRKREREKRIA